MFATGDPQPSNWNDCTVYRESGIDLQLAVHRRVRARVEHAIGQMKTWKILRDYRRAAHTLTATASGIAYLRNIAFLG